MLSYFYDDTQNSFDVHLLEHIKNKNNEKVEKILENAKDLYNAIDASESSLLHYAAEFGNEIIALYLIKLGSKVNLQNSDGNTSLLLATKGQHSATIKLLLESDADVYISDKEGKNALQMALHASPTNVEIAKIFLEQLKNDCSSDSTEIAKRLMEINCPIYVAVILKDIYVTTCMLSECCPIDAKDPSSGKTALHVAVENLDTKMVTLLTNVGADVNAKDALNRTPLAMINNFDDEGKAMNILRQLLDAQTELSSCDDDGFMQMHFILKNGSEKAVKAVLDCEFDILKTDEHKRNILHYLAMNDNTGIFDVIHDMSILDLVGKNARDQDGLTPLHYAMSVGNKDFVDYFNGELATNISSNKGVTPFLQAIESTSESTLEKRVECVKIFMMYHHVNPDIVLGHYFKFHNTKSAINRDLAFLESVVAMLAVWKANDKTISQSILNQIELYPKLKEYFDLCMSEVDKLKNEIIYKNISLFDCVADNEPSVINFHTFSSKRYGCKISNMAKKYDAIQIYQDILNNYANYVLDWKTEDSLYLTGFFIHAILCVIIWFCCDVIFYYLYGSSFVICAIILCGLSYHEDFMDFFEKYFT